MIEIPYRCHLFLRVEAGTESKVNRNDKDGKRRSKE